MIYANRKFKEKDAKSQGKIQKLFSIIPSEFILCWQEKD
jgi:hypothetical protein